MRFTSPLFLLLLLFVPVIAWMGWPVAGSDRKREVASLLLRLAIVSCLIFALAGLNIVRSGNELAVVFLVDVSDSMPPAAVAAEMDYLQNALEEMGPDDQAAVVMFGANALVERSMSPVNSLGLVASVPVTNQTDLAEAIRLGMALFPSGSARRMVILSDGAETSGDALGAAEVAGTSGVQIVSVPILNRSGAEALVTGADAPNSLRSGEQFDLAVSVQASQPMRAALRVLAGSQIVYEGEHNLRRGQQTFSLPLTAGAPGFVSYQVQLAPEQDGFYQNNRLDAFSQVEGPPRILMVAPATGERLPGGGTRPDEHSALLAALQAASFQVDVVTPGRLPSDLPSLAQYDSVVLVDVPARTLGLNQMENLKSYVHDLGGGLVVTGGPTSYGVGGYYGTPVEEALPVEMQVKDEQRRPSLAMVFIIDHSGSMSETSGGVQKLELAKEAAARSTELLFPTDRIGVIAFDDVASWVVPMTDLSNQAEVVNAIGSIQVGGGTDIMAGLQAMAKVLPDDPARVKHVVLLTDGGANPMGIPELVQQLFEQNGITLSTVAVGRDAAPFLADLAALGGGRYHFTADAGSIPSIFTEETSLATRAYIVEEPFFPALVNASPILRGIDSTPPRLYGYVASTAKDLAQVIFESDKGDPVLAAWQYGLGRSVAFTSDVTGRWAKDWVRWEGFPTFWAQAVRSTIGNTADTALETNILTEDGQAHIVLDAYKLGGDFLNGYQIEANVVAPDGKIQLVTLSQVAPGRYEAYFQPGEQGVYLIRLSGQSDDSANGEGFSKTIGWTLSYSPEYLHLESDPDLLLRLATITGGKVASPDPAEIFVHDLKAFRDSRPVWPWLLALAAVLLPFDVAVRRLILTRQDLARLREWLAGKAVARKQRAQKPELRSQRMDMLFQAKDRAQSETITPPDAPAQIDQPKVPTITKPGAKETIEKDLVEASQKEQLPESMSSTTEALLARKKSIREKRD